MGTWPLWWGWGRDVATQWRTGLLLSASASALGFRWALQRPGDGINSSSSSRVAPLAVAAGTGVLVFGGFCVFRARWRPAAVAWRKRPPRPAPSWLRMRDVSARLLPPTWSEAVRSLAELFDLVDAARARYTGLEPSHSDLSNLAFLASIEAFNFKRSQAQAQAQALAQAAHPEVNAKAKVRAKVREQSGDSDLEAGMAAVENFSGPGRTKEGADFEASPKLEAGPQPEATDEVARRAGHFMRVANATYGFVFCSAMGLIGRQRTVELSARCKSVAEADRACFREVSGRALDVAYVSSSAAAKDPRSHLPKHFVLVDHDERSVVVAIRGTSSASDAFTDLACDLQPIADANAGAGTGNGIGAGTGAGAGAALGLRSSVSVPVRAHGGMLESARNVLRECRPALLAATARHASYDVVVCGHSLGGGTGLLLTLLLQEPALAREFFPASSGPRANFRANSRAPARRLHCFAFGAPPVVDLQNAPTGGAHIVNVVCGADIVPRLSLWSADRLAAKLAGLDRLTHTGTVSRWDRFLGFERLPPAKQHAALQAVGLEHSESESESESLGVGFKLPVREQDEDDYSSAAEEGARDSGAGNPSVRNSLGGRDLSGERVSATEDSESEDAPYEMDSAQRARWQASCVRLWHPGSVYRLAGQGRLALVQDPGEDLRDIVVDSAAAFLLDHLPNQYEASYSRPCTLRK